MEQFPLNANRKIDRRESKDRVKVEAYTYARKIY
jgi:hypothetical protein